MKRLFASAAALTMLASVAHAQTPPAGGPDPKGPPPAMGQGMRPPMMGMDGGPEGMGPHGHPPMGMGFGPMGMEGGTHGGPRGSHIHLHKGDADLDLACKPDETTVVCTDQAIRILQAVSPK